jgi:hypothetical protein
MRCKETNVVIRKKDEEEEWLYVLVKINLSKRTEKRTSKYNLMSFILSI